MWPNNYHMRQLWLRPEQTPRPESLVVPGTLGARFAVHDLPSLADPFSMWERSEGSEEPALLPSPNTFFRPTPELPPFANGGALPFEEIPATQVEEDVLADESSSQGTPFNSSESTPGPSSPPTSDVPEHGGDPEDEPRNSGYESEDEEYLVLEVVDGEERLWWPGDRMPEFDKLSDTDIAHLSDDLRIYGDGKVMLNFEHDSPFWEFRRHLARYMRARCDGTGFRFR